MKVCFVGIGSIAKRHIGNLCDICKELEIPVQIDALRRETSAVSDTPAAVAEVYTDASQLPSDYDIMFITNPTEYHADMLQRLHDKAGHFFIEKPITSVDTIDKLKGFTPRSGSVYYVACPLRYTNVISYLKRELNVENVNSVRCISSSYLPDWRPGTDYRKTYSAHKDLGGGVDIDLIHEWDYLNYLFGMPCDVKSFMGKVSKLEIDSCDYAIYIAEYDNMIAELHLDYFGRKSMRTMEIFTDDDTIIADLISGTVKYCCSGRVIDLAEDRDSFQKKELRSFLKTVTEGKESLNDILTAVKTLKLTQGIVFDGDEL